MFQSCWINKHEKERNLKLMGTSTLESVRNRNTTYEIDITVVVRFHSRSVLVYIKVCKARNEFALVMSGSKIQ